MEDPKKILLEGLRIQAQLKIYHWQTRVFAEHEAFGDAYDTIQALFDKFIEAFQGRFGRITVDGISNIPLMDLASSNIPKFVTSAAAFFNQVNIKLYVTDSNTALFVLTDEIELALLKLSYFLSFDEKWQNQNQK